MELKFKSTQKPFTRIKMYRFLLGMTLQELATALGSYDSQIANLENKGIRPNAKTVARYNEFFNKHDIQVTVYDFTDLVSSDDPIITELLSRKVSKGKLSRKIDKLKQNTTKETSEEHGDIDDKKTTKTNSKVEED